MSKKSGAMVMALVWSCCWMIQVIAGTPVGTPELDRAFGAPLTVAELACVPTFGKAGETSLSTLLFFFSIFQFTLAISKHPRTSPCPREMTSSFYPIRTPTLIKSGPMLAPFHTSSTLHLVRPRIFISFRYYESEFVDVLVFESDAKARCAIGYAMAQYHKNTCIRFVPRTVQTDYVQINKYDTTR
jgi:hypothetical protein